MIHPFFHTPPKFWKFCSFVGFKPLLHLCRLAVGDLVYRTCCGPPFQYGRNYVLCFQDAQQKHSRRLQPSFVCVTSFKSCHCQLLITPTVFMTCLYLDHLA
ncbi:unnamed protein product [Ixodes hexagonus]